MRELSNKERILDAARLELAERGYDGTSLRNVARRARVDVRLVHHYFGPKGLLFRAATRPERSAAHCAGAGGTGRADGTGGTGDAATAEDRPGAAPAARLARTLRAAWSEDHLTWRALLVSAMTHAPAGARLLAVLTRRLPLPQSAAEGEQGELRRALLASQVIGLAVLAEAAALGLPSGPEPSGAEEERRCLERLEAHLDAVLSAELVPDAGAAPPVAVPTAGGSDAGRR